MQKILCCSSVYAMSEASINTNELTSSRCKTIRVTERISICAFVRNNVNEFSHGRVFYQLHRPETIQFRHLIVVRKKSNGLFVHVTEDEEIRQLLGIPVEPEETAEYEVDETILNSYDIFIESINTDLFPDTGEGDNAASTADGVLNDHDRKREKVAECLAKAVVRENTMITQTRIKYELTASMLKRFEDVKMSWQSYTNHVDIVDIADLSTTGIKINTLDITPREIFKHLQWFVELYPDAENLQYVPCKLPIGGSDIAVFYLSRSTDKAVDQILVYTNDSDWPDSTKRSLEGNGYWAPTYNTMVEVLKDFSNQSKLAQEMIKACQSNLNDQPNFSESLRIRGNEEENANMIRHTVEFLVVTMVAEAATPTALTRAKFIELMADTIIEIEHFPEKSAMPQLGHDDLGARLKTGRSPTADDIALGLLYKMRDEEIAIDEAFSDNNYPIRQQGGTQLGRVYLHKKGDNIIHIPSFLSVLKAGHGQTD